MHFRSTLLVSLALASVAGAQDRAFVEIRVDRAEVYVGEEFALRLRAGVDAAFWETSLIPLFRQQLDVPVQIDADADELRGLTPLDARWHAGGNAEREATLALRDDVVRAERLADDTIDGKRFALFALERRYIALEPGPIAVPAPSLRYAYATSFVDDFVNGRVAEDRVDVTLDGEAFSFVVLALPDAGRPGDFTGAVGEFTARATTETRELVVGESMRVELRVEGVGSFEHFDAPKLDELEGFDVFGLLDASDATGRTIIYDIAPNAESVAAVPALTLPFFDPVARVYRTAATDPIPLRVLPRPAAAKAPDVAPVSDAGEADETTASNLTPVLGVAVGLALVAIAIVAATRRRRLPGAPAVANVSGVVRSNAAAEFRAALDAADTDLAQAFTTYLAQRLGCTPAEAFTHGLERRLVDAGYPSDLGARCGATVDAMLEERYGGGASRIDAQTVRALVDELETTPSPGYS